MKNRWFWFATCTVLGLVALGIGLVIPVYLRSVDAGVIRLAGQNTAALVPTGLALAKENKLGAAQLLAKAAVERNLPDREKLTEAVARLAVRHPEWVSWGGGDTRVENFFHPEATSTVRGIVPMTDFMVPAAVRAQVLTGWLSASQRPLVQELLKFRTATNTVIFPPATSASGQALDTAICVCGFLAERGQLGTGLNNKLLAAATDANTGSNTERLERALLDLMSLGQRFNYGQLAAFLGKIGTVEELRVAAGAVREYEGQLPVVFAAMELSGNPAEVGRYLLNFGQSGTNDLGWSLRYGAGSVNELVKRNQRVHDSGWRGRLGQSVPLTWLYAFTLRWSVVALVLKWLCYVGCGFLLALAVHYARPQVTELEKPLQVRGFHLAREIIFALGFLVAILLVSEPFLAQESQKKAEVTLRLHLPTMSSAVTGKTAGENTKFMNAKSLLTLLLFFVLQALLYVACLVKLAEIRRQQIPPRLKLKLLENEEHLFDSGLYLGFAGTIISLILVSMGVMQPSLMAAYGSTSFGIIFVSIFKIFHLRPYKRQLLMESELTSERSPAVSRESTLAAPL